MIEVWKNIKGFEGLYQISNIGRVKSLERFRNNHGTLQRVSEKIKSSRKDPQGYLQTDLYKDNKQFTKRVHRLVAETFITNENNKETVNHIDGDKDNNTIFNLEWATSEEQNKHLYKHNLKKQENIDKAVRAMNNINKKKVMCIETGEIFNACADVSRKYSNRSDGSLVSRACRQNRIAYGYHWKYV